MGKQKMFAQLLILVATILKIIGKSDCDHIGPRPIGYCGIDIMTHCVQNEKNGKWFIEMIEYNDANCTGTIKKQRKVRCLQSQNCQCGTGICDEDLVFTIKHVHDQVTVIQDDEEPKEFESYLPKSTNFDDKDEDEFDCNSIEFTFKPIVYIKNQCISGRFISHLLDKPNKDLNGTILKCDNDKQQLSYYEYDNDECEGDPIFEEPEILIDASDLPCVTINC